MKSPYPASTYLLKRLYLNKIYRPLLAVTVREGAA